MIDLRPLIVVTGTVHVEGGERNRVRSSNAKNGSSRQEIVVDRSVSVDRRAANVIVVDYGRRINQIALVRTPFGILVDPKRLDELKRLLGRIDKKIRDFNTTRTGTARVANYVLWEPLEGVRKTAVAGWLLARKIAKDESVIEVIKELRPTSSVAA